MIEFDRVVVRFDKKTVLNGISFTIPANKISYLIGGSGSGKSTILKVMMGFLKPQSGSVVIDGEDVAGLSDRKYARIRKKMGMVFQGLALFDSMTVFDNVAFYPVYRERARMRDIAPRVHDLLDQLDLKGTEKLYPAELSGGMRRRVALARALIYQPKILLYDEPTTGLDPITTELVDGIIAETNNNFNVTSVVVSHDMASVLDIADHVIFVHDGETIEIGGHDAILGCTHLPVREFIKGMLATAEKVAANAKGVS
jgi:phospholipid/cholesterol/gamma-HCH transport system ATP-binding protein